MAVTRIVAIVLWTSLALTTMALASASSSKGEAEGKDKDTDLKEVSELRERLERLRRQVEWLTRDNEDLTNKNKLLSIALHEEEDARNSAALTIQNLLTDVHNLKQQVDKKNGICDIDTDNCA